MDGCVGYLAKPLTIPRLTRMLWKIRGAHNSAAPRIRWPAPLRAVVLDENGGDALAWDVRDLSETGAFLLAAAPVPVGTKLQLELRAEGLACSVAAEVVRVQEPRWAIAPVTAVAFRAPAARASPLPEFRRALALVERPPAVEF
jgi:hypothetical protein